MVSLLNGHRPPVFCPGCSHHLTVQALDQALVGLGLRGDQVVIVSDIGCSGLFDTFFHTHALHGLHGRALTYATGIKLARPELTVIVTMGDGGLGIGGAHVLAACRRNLDLTLLVLNNFNFGMTGGQCSATTPSQARAASGFLNRLEPPLDICRVAQAAGAPWVRRISAHDPGLTECLQAAIGEAMFSLVDIHSICPGRFSGENRLTPAVIDAHLTGAVPLESPAAAALRLEYGQAYRLEAAKAPPSPEPCRIPVTCTPVAADRQELVLLGRAGQRVITAGEVLSLAGAAAGCHASQKNDYPITVMRGHSISEVILDPHAIGFTGIDQPSVVLALAEEGVRRRQAMLTNLPASCLVLKAADVDLPPGLGRVVEVDFRRLAIPSSDRALAMLAVLAKLGNIVNREMLDAALSLRFSGQLLQTARKVLALAERWTV